MTYNSRTDLGGERFHRDYRRPASLTSTSNAFHSPEQAKIEAHNLKMKTMYGPRVVDPAPRHS